jgi:hypothetical protein
VQHGVALRWDSACRGSPSEGTTSIPSARPARAIGACSRIERLHGSDALQKVWDLRTPCGRLPNGQTQLYVGLHLIHEVTSPQAFDMLRARGWACAPDRTVATVDHIVPTSDQRRPSAT